MEKKNNRGLLIGLLIGIIIMLLVFIFLFITGIISFKTTTITDDGNASENNNIEVISNNEAVNISKGVLDKYFTDVFYGHSGPYCGEGVYDFPLNYYNAENGEVYLPSKQYKTKNEVLEYLKTYLSDKFINKIISEKDYLEKEDKLYCLTPRKASLSYIKEKSTYEVNEVTENRIVGTGKVAYNAVDTEMILTCKYTLVKDANNWVLNEYEEEL